MMMQEEIPDDWVIATGETHTVKEFAKLAFKHAGLDYKKYIKINKNLLRPAEVDTLRANYKKAEKKLNWKPNIDFKNLVKQMVDEDLEFVKNSKY